jgi:hypothetical protein
MPSSLGCAAAAEPAGPVLSWMVWWRRSIPSIGTFRVELVSAQVPTGLDKAYGLCVGSCLYYINCLEVMVAWFVGWYVIPLHRTKKKSPASTPRRIVSRKLRKKSWKEPHATFINPCPWRDDPIRLPNSPRPRLSALEPSRTVLHSIPSRSTLESFPDRESHGGVAHGVLERDVWVCVL